jgi:hypothetical protein
MSLNASQTSRWNGVAAGSASFTRNVRRVPLKYSSSCAAPLATAVGATPFEGSRFSPGM